MANTLTDMKNILVSQNAINPWLKELLPMSCFSTNFSSDIAQQGDTVRVPLIGAPNASSVFDGDYTKNSDSTITSIPVTLNKHRFNTVHMSATERASMSTDMLSRLVANATKQLAIDVLSDVLSCVTATNYGEAVATVTGDAFDYDKVIAIRKACGADNMPLANRSLILNPVLFSALLSDARVAQSANQQITANAIVDAALPRIAGFTTYETNALPENSEKLAGIACDPSGIAVAMRYLEPVANYMDSGAVTDPTTGITYGFLEFSDTRANRVNITVECLYGYAVARKAAIKRIVTA